MEFKLELTLEADKIHLRLMEAFSWCLTLDADKSFGHCYPLI